MATINRISGNILQDNLVRGANLAVQGNLLFVDVVNTRVGVNTATTTHTLTVEGDTNISGNVFANGVQTLGNIFSPTAVLAGNATLSSNGGQAVLSGITGVDLQYNESSNTSVVSVGAQEVVIQVADGVTQAEIAVYPANVTVSNGTGGDTEFIVIGNITGGNIASLGNITVGGVDVANSISVTGNIQANNITALISLSANTANIDTNLSVGNTVAANTVTANTVVAVLVDSDNIIASNSFTATGNITLDNLRVSNTTVQANIAQGNITLIPAADQLVIVDIDTGFTIPVGNTNQQPAVAITGTIRFNTDINSIEVYDGTNWEAVGRDSVVITDQTLFGDGATTEFALIQNTLTNAVIVSTNGIVQRPSVAYTISGNVITFAEAPEIADVIDIRFIADIEIVNQLTNADGSFFVLEPTGVANAAATHSIQLPSYTVAEAAALGNVASGQVIYCSNGDAGTPCLAVYSVNAWRVVSLGANISST